jgi:hypothetical protein
VVDKNIKNTISNKLVIVLLALVDISKPTLKEYRMAYTIRKAHSTLNKARCFLKKLRAVCDTYK